MLAASFPDVPFAVAGFVYVSGEGRPTVMDGPAFTVPFVDATGSGRGTAAGASCAGVVSLGVGGAGLQAGTAMGAGAAGAGRTAGGSGGFKKVLPSKNLACSGSTAQSAMPDGKGIFKKARLTAKSRRIAACSW